MISLTMSRISSREEFGVELGELGEVDRLDQGAEDRALDLVIGFGMPRVGGRRRDGGEGSLGTFVALAGAGADTSGAPSPMDGIGERPPSPPVAALGAGCGRAWGAAGSGAGDGSGPRMRRRRKRAQARDYRWP